jgi:DNA (cytosine-5)-methyltransferase 1
LKIVDLFCGCGGLSLGLEKAGLEVVWACDHWDKAISVYRDNFDHPAVSFDLTKVPEAVKIIAEAQVDGIVGGPPCQDFSSAGKRQEGGRADLTDCFAEIVTQVRPRFFIMENVPRARLSRAYFGAREKLKSAGYGLTEVVLDASLCGVPQSRKRFFSIGILGQSDGVMETKIHSRLSKKSLTVFDYLGDEFGVEYYYRHPRNYSRRAIYSVNEPSATVRGVNRPVPSGYPGHRNDATRIFKGLRSLTTAERARIQTFPSNFVWNAAKTHLELMIGNAVPVELAKFVGEAIQVTFQDMDKNDG